MTKRMRIILAIITGLVTALMAFQLSFATPATVTNSPDTNNCTTATRLAYEDQRARSTIEQTPSYRLSIAESFLSGCETPLHVQAVAKHAARAAIDTGAAETALSYFDLALGNGAYLTDKEQLDYMLALSLNGQADRAWSLRDDLIDDWLDRATRIADITSINVRDGIIHKIEFHSPVGKVETQTHWLAQPHGEGWPAAVSLETDPALVALATFRMGPRAQTLQDMTLVQCRGRKTAARSYGEIAEAVAEETALETLKTYLSQPQTPRPRAAGQPAESCYAVDRLFVPLR